MRTIAQKTAFQIALKNCSKEVRRGGRGKIIFSPLHYIINSLIIYIYHLHNSLSINIIICICNNYGAYQVAQKNLPANEEDTRDMGSVPGLGRSPGEGNGNPFQYSWLENSMDRGAWRAIVYAVTKSWTWLSIHTQKRTEYLWFVENFYLPESHNSMR